MQMNECAKGMKPLVCVHHVVSLTWNAEVWPCHVSKYHKMVQYRGGRRLKVHAWRSSSSHSFTFQLWAPLFHCPQSLFFSFIGRDYATASGPASQTTLVLAGRWLWMSSQHKHTRKGMPFFFHNIYNYTFWLGLAWCRLVWKFYSIKRFYSLVFCQ